jgi:REP element-mobilizing transposase RayT
MNKRTPDSQEASSDNRPLAYFLTFSCYGVRLHGDERGSVDRDRNAFDTPFIDSQPAREKAERKRMKQDQYPLDEHRRVVLRDTVQEVCAHRVWRLLALHIRANHVHVVLQGDTEPDSMLNDFKRYGSRNLNEKGFDESDRKRWAYHGSTKYLWNPDNVQNAIRYTLHKQGEPMETFLHPGLNDLSFESYDNRKNPRLRRFLLDFWTD